jgi:hypothetical protein
MEQNGYRGFFVMATGKGKTWTAIYAAERIQQHEKDDYRYMRSIQASWFNSGMKMLKRYLLNRGLLKYLLKTQYGNKKLEKDNPFQALSGQSDCYYLDDYVF